MKKIGVVLLLTISFADESWRIYDDSSVGRVDITIDSSTLDWIYENVESDSLHPCTIHFQNATIDETIESVGFRLRGNTSRGSQKKSFKLDFNHFETGRDFYDVEKINVNGEHNDVSIIRSKICWDFFNRIELVASRAAHIEVYINGVYFGLYILIEHIDDTFLSKRFSDDSGNLWKCLWPADLTYRGNQGEDYYPWFEGGRPYELKTNKDENNFNDLARLIRIINQEPDSLSFILDISSFIKYLTANILTGSWDDYRSLRNNYYLYHQPDKDQFTLIPYDYDNTFGVDWFGVDWATINPYSYHLVDNSDRPLADLIINDASYRNLFTHFIDHYLEFDFSLDIWGSYIDSVKSKIDSSAINDLYRTLDYGFTIDDYHNSYSEGLYVNQHIKKGLKEFFLERVSALQNQLEYVMAEPLIYNVNIAPSSPLIGDSINVQVSCFGYPNVENMNVIVHQYNTGEYHSYPLAMQSISSTIVEERDLWVATLSPLNTAGRVGFQLIATNESQISSVFPRTGDWQFHVRETIGSGEIVINEFVAKNETGIVDENAENEDWIELYNVEPDTMFLQNFYLTDNSNNLMKWQFQSPEAFIPPHGYLLVWCDEDQDQGPFHTNFKLSTNGEFIALVNPDGITVVDSLTFGPQTADISFGRTTDGGEEWSFMNPTPGQSNSSIALATETLPGSFKLTSYPNPFNSNVNFQFNKNEDGYLEIQVMDILGRVQKTIFSGELSQGEYNWVWNGINNSGKPCASGLWFVRVKSGNEQVFQKIVLIK